MTRAEEEWLEIAESLLQTTYGVSLNDVTADGTPDSDWFDDSPDEFVSWIAAKYDLEPFVYGVWPR